MDKLVLQEANHKIEDELSVLQRQLQINKQHSQATQQQVTLF